MLPLNGLKLNTRDGPYWSSGENSLELIKLSSINKVSSELIELFRQVQIKLRSQWRSQPNNLVMPCKFCIIIIINFFREIDCFLQSMNTEIFATC